jgi:hypothetical protein
MLIWSTRIKDWCRHQREIIQEPADKIMGGQWALKLPSWMTFLRAVQIAHKVTRTLTNSSVENVSIIEKIQHFALGSEVAHICSKVSSSDKAHTHRAIGHSISE